MKPMRTLPDIPVVVNAASRETAFEAHHRILTGQIRQARAQTSDSEWTELWMLLLPQIAPAMPAVANRQADRTEAETP